MADLVLIPNPKQNPEKETLSRVDRVSRLIHKAEALMAQAVVNTEEVKALASEMDEFGLKHWARDLRKLLE